MKSRGVIGCGTGVKASRAHRCSVGFSIRKSREYYLAGPRRCGGSQFLLIASNQGLPDIKIRVPPHRLGADFSLVVIRSLRLGRDWEDERTMTKFPLETKAIARARQGFSRRLKHLHERKGNPMKAFFIFFRFSLQWIALLVPLLLCPGSTAAVTFTVTPSSVSNTYRGHNYAPDRGAE